MTPALTRRGLLRALGAAAVVWPRAAGAQAAPRRPRFVLALLRGGLDGLDAARPVGDPAFRGLRPGDDGPPLDADFSWGPAFAGLAPWFDRGELAVLHAVASPYRGHSHFEGGDVLEGGADGPRPDGWLDRALTGRPGHAPPLALGPTIPLVLRGAGSPSSFSGRTRVFGDDRLLDRVLALYEADPELGPPLREGLALRERAEAAAAGAATDGKDPSAALRVVAGLLADPAGPDVAVAQLTGFDTHQNQVQALGRAAAGLPTALATLREGLGDAWADTVVVAVSEFGRTVLPNGTAGTDHGTAGVAFLAGGPVRGGRVLGAWPGLAAEHRLDGRDLRPTTDVRAVWKAVLRDHLGLDEARIAEVVLPGSGAIPALEGLWRT